jgi:sirohydrochlorin ferrochelatase
VPALADRLRAAGVPPGTPVVLAAAGSTDPRAAGDARNQAALLASHLQAPVLAAFASAARPAVGEAVAGLAARTGGPVAVASYLLAPGVFHDRLRASGAAWVGAPIGDHPAVAGLVLERFRAAGCTPGSAGSGA